MQKMLQPCFRSSSRVPADSSLTGLATLLSSLTFCPKHAHLRLQLPNVFVRHASHAAQGRANGPKDSAGRRLGAKKTASEYVIPGNIIFKQRGTKWFPGENVGIGKDHTIYAKVAGYVRYYRNPAIHPKRRYIGVALDKDGPRSKLPTPPNAPTRRRLGMHASPMKESAESAAAFLESHLTSNSVGSSLDTHSTGASDSATGRFWDSNYEIGRAAENKGVKVREYDRGDRWLAWRKRAKRVQAGMLAKAAKANRKTKGKKTNKGAAAPAKRL